MDTRDQALTKLTRLHDESHPTPSTSSMPTMKLLTPYVEYHEVVDGEGFMMTTIMNPPLRGPKWTPEQPSRGRTGGDCRSVS